MRPFLTLANSVLLDSLTDYYSQYREFLKEGGDKLEFQSCRNTLISLLSELNLRMGHNHDFQRYLVQLESKEFH
jgi:hypothetical protein